MDFLTEPSYSLYPALEAPKITNISRGSWQYSFTNKKPRSCFCQTPIRIDSIPIWFKVQASLLLVKLIFIFLSSTLLWIPLYTCFRLHAHRNPQWFLWRLSFGFLMFSWVECSAGIWMLFFHGFPKCFWHLGYLGWIMERHIDNLNHWKRLFERPQN